MVFAVFLPNQQYLGDGFKQILFSPPTFLGKIPILTMFQLGWNHQLGMNLMIEPTNLSETKPSEVPSLERSLQLLGALHLSWMQKVGGSVADF